MPSYTSLGLAKPFIADAIDEDLWGGYLNDNFDLLNTLVKGARDIPATAKTLDYSIVQADRHTLLTANAIGGNIIFTLPDATLTDNGFWVAFKKSDVSTNTLTIDGYNAQTIDGSATFVLYNQGNAVVLVCDGTNWNVLDSYGGGAFFHVQDTKPQGTDGGTFTSGDWRTRDLNTIVSPRLSGASLSSNQITLPAGTYYIEFSASAFGNTTGPNAHRARVQDVTNTLTLIPGTSERCFNNASNAANSSRSTGSGLFTLTGITKIELQHICSTTETGDGFGKATSFGVELYSDVKIWKK